MNTPIQIGFTDIQRIIICKHSNKSTDKKGLILDTTMFLLDFEYAKFYLDDIMSGIKYSKKNQKRICFPKLKALD